MDAGKKLVRWDILYDGVVGLKRLRFGDIETDLIYDNGQLRITSNKPYTLILNGKKIHVKNHLELQLRKDDIVSICEMKWASEPYVIDKISVEPTEKEKSSGFSLF